MPSFLDDPVSILRGVGAYYIKKLTKLGIVTIEDLLSHFPVRYETPPQVTKISEIISPGIYTVVADVKTIQVRRAFRRRLFIVEGTLGDSTGNIKVVWFGQSYLARSIPTGSVGVFSGKVSETKNGLSLQGPTYEIISRTPIDHEHIDLDRYDLKHTSGLVPVYPETRGLTSRGIRFLIKPLLTRVEEIPEWMPESILRTSGLPGIGKSFRDIHFPDSLEDALKARTRFAFGELFLLQLFLLLARKNNQKLSAPAIAVDIPGVKEFLKTLPFTLTIGQKRAAWDILQDMAGSFPMNRLLNGDVGSGKTVIAFIAALQALRAGYQAVLLVPTEVLARQHFERAKQLLSPACVSVALCLSKEIQISTEGMNGEIKRSSFLSLLTEKTPLFVIGTHAVIQKDVRFSRLGLVIVDEQHRFGIHQRQALLKGKEKDGNAPHLLTMTATPIPRTLALTIWGDLDISLLSEFPMGRKQIITKVMSEMRRAALYAFVRKEAASGNRIFIICPRIEEPEKELTYTEYLRLDTKAVKQEHERLQQKVFPELQLGILHGKLKSLEKESAMRDFMSGKTPILVSTSVIEVGVDVPDATVMIIEGADHFGLAQLHQFRGRVGRSEKQSYCFLLSGTGTKTALERLTGFAKTHDGFALAEQDLKSRGPGEFVGTKQSGIPDLAMSSLKDTSLVVAARTSAQKLLEHDPSLKIFPFLKKRLAGFGGEIHLE